METHLTRSPGGPLHEFDDGIIVITDTQYFTTMINVGTTPATPG